MNQNPTTSSPERAGGGLPDLSVDEPLTLVIFGGTGDLTRRKLLPALFALFVEKLLPDVFRIVACGRREYDDQSFRREMRGEVETFKRVSCSEEQLDTFIGRVFYSKGELDDPAAYDALRQQIDQKEFPGNRVFYLSVAPSFFAPVLRHLKNAGLIYPAGSPPWSRVVIEKPFGRDLASALELNAEVFRLLDESQVYRIDHYLGKETVQNILSFRFANTIFEPLFTNHYVDHIQITASETVGMESGRGAYYDTAGALRDMMQNHLLQLLCLVTMEPPSGLTADALRNEKVKVLQSIRIPTLDSIRNDVVRAQYAAGELGPENIPAYVDEDRVAGDSSTESFVAARFFIDNWRWAGVPILLRTGKRMARKQTSISVQFKRPPMDFFKTVQCEDDFCDLADAQPNVLTFRIQPDEGISLNFATKRPSMHLVVQSSELDFNYADTHEGELPEAYERLLMDVMRGDAALFTRSDEVEAAWKLMDPVLQGWRERGQRIPMHFYVPGSWGPQAADTLFDSGEGRWTNS